MLKSIFGTRPATRVDVVLAAGAAVMAVINFINIKQQYKTEQEEEENA